jgi:hypothetical protein
VDLWMTSALSSQHRVRIFAVLRVAASGAIASRPSVRRDVLRSSIREWVEAGSADRELRREVQREFSEVLDAEIARSARLIVAGGRAK